jgi:hypothetical protein
MLTKVRSSVFPDLGGPVLVDTVGVPRYWATVWVSFLPGDLPDTLFYLGEVSVERKLDTQTCAKDSAIPRATIRIPLPKGVRPPSSPQTSKVPTK